MQKLTLKQPQPAGLKNRDNAFSDIGENRFGELGPGGRGALKLQGVSIDTLTIANKGRAGSPSGWK